MPPVHATLAAAFALPSRPLTPRFDFECTEVGVFPVPDRCDLFYECTGAGAAPFVAQCPLGTLFSPEDRICEFAESVECAAAVARRGMVR